jgi:hypothetical protein
MAVGRHARTSGARIAGVVSCLPPRVVENDSFIEQFGDGVAEVTKMTGVEKRHYAEDGVTTSDLCEKAANTLIEKLGLGAGLDRRAHLHLPVAGLSAAGHGDPAAGPAGAQHQHDGLGRQPRLLGLSVRAVDGDVGHPDRRRARVLLAVGDVSTRSIDMTDRATACCSAMRLRDRDRGR